jgi:hypothetical protein
MDFATHNHIIICITTKITSVSLLLSVVDYREYSFV